MRPALLVILLAAAACASAAPVHSQAVAATAPPSFQLRPPAECRSGSELRLVLDHGFNDQCQLGPCLKYEPPEWPRARCLLEWYKAPGWPDSVGDSGMGDFPLPGIDWFRDRSEDPLRDPSALDE